MDVLKNCELLETGNPNLGSLIGFNYRDNLELGLFVEGSEGERYILSLSFSDSTNGPCLLVKNAVSPLFVVLKEYKFIPHLSFGKDLTNLRFQDYPVGTIFQFSDGFLISAFWGERDKVLFNVETGKINGGSPLNSLAYPSWKIVQKNIREKDLNQPLFEFPTNFRGPD